MAAYSLGNFVNCFWLISQRQAAVIQHHLITSSTLELWLKGLHLRRPLVVAYWRCRLVFNNSCASSLPQTPGDQPQQEQTFFLLCPDFFLFFFFPTMLFVCFCDCGPSEGTFVLLLSLIRVKWSRCFPTVIMNEYVWLLLFKSALTSNWFHI